MTIETYTENLRYSLAKRVPDMDRGFTIETCYGSIEIGANQAPPFIAAVRKVLEKEISSCVAQLNKVRADQGVALAARLEVNKPAPATEEPAP